MFGDKRSMRADRVRGYQQYKFRDSYAPVKRNYVGMISTITLMVLVAIFIVVLIAQSPY